MTTTNKIFARCEFTTRIAQFYVDKADFIIYHFILFLVRYDACIGNY